MSEETIEDPKTFEDGHRELWRQLEESGSGSKAKMPIWKDERYKHLFTNKVLHPMCFACYAGRCCPIDWGIGEDGRNLACTKIGSPFHSWMGAESKEERKYYAGIIKGLPWTDMGELLEEEQSEEGV